MWTRGRNLFGGVCRGLPIHWGSRMSSAAGRAASSGVRRGIVWLSLVMLTVGVGIGSCVAETWRGLVVAPEHRCSPYDKKLD